MFNVIPHNGTDRIKKLVSYLAEKDDLTFSDQRKKQSRSPPVGGRDAKKSMDSGGIPLSLET